ncbi:carbonic anhydrase [Chlorobium sp. KB01]|uniref:carbonic anhydrase n=1 Tax=Chlorobium sp. KB01 TaxID=1917528 RepID=UPI0009759A75|nr:carbonic anhydrase [Chlorobium sp. KB01]
MRKLVAICFTLLSLLSAETAHAGHAEAEGIAPQKALTLLLDGNRQFARKGAVSNLNHHASVSYRKSLATAQHPFAVIIACSDSRLSPEILFDKGLGELFVVRVAGNIVGAHELGSVEYAVEHLGAKLVMVLGHERCGAVTATYEARFSGSKVEGNIGSLVASIDPAVTAVMAEGAKATKAELVDRCIHKNVEIVAGQLSTKSPIIAEALQKGEIRVVKAYYDLDDGTVSVTP